MPWIVMKGYFLLFVLIIKAYDKIIQTIKPCLLLGLESFD